MKCKTGMHLLHDSMYPHEWAGSRAYSAGYQLDGLHTIAALADIRDVVRQTTRGGYDFSHRFFLLDG